jgi:hypothetical protein
VHGWEVCPAKEPQRMTETNQTRILVATLRDALQAMAAELGLTRDGVLHSAPFSGVLKQF